MTANITGYAIYQGLATSLDTLCAQAYGSGRKHLVGLQLQRMVYFLWVLTIPIGIVWLAAEKILEIIVPEKESAEFAGLYLRVLLIGAPGYALFESGKRFVQAQGLFSATTYVLLVAAPLNAFMNWLFVWKFQWGFIGAPIAVAVTDNLLPLFLFMYVYFVDGRQCWSGFTRRAFHNWGPMIKLALPGLLMVEAEFLAFEILTLAASYFGTTHLAAQSILSTITALTFQIPFPISIAASTRVANLIGASLSEAAKTSAKVCCILPPSPKPNSRKNHFSRLVGRRAASPAKP
jgi:MATE family multidrug resistance protein